MQVKWLRRALRNLEQEAAYIARDNSQAAARLVAEADAATRLLTRYPDMGRPGRVPGTRELVMSDSPCLIPYRVREQPVEIPRVLHASRKWPDQLQDP